MTENMRGKHFHFPRNMGRSLLIFFFGFWVSAFRLVPLALAGEARSIGLKDAAGRGVFNIGPSQAKVTLEIEPSLGREILKLDFTVPSGSAAGVWTKGYPATLGSKTIGVLSVGARALEASKAGETTVTLEIKGDKGVQKIIVPVEGVWSSVQARVDWASVGEMKEAVFVVSPRSGDRSGTLFLDLQFLQGPAVEKAAPEIRLLDASGRGVFNIGASEGKAQVTLDDKRKRDVVRLDYKLPAGAVVGLWTKGYPSGLNPGMVPEAKVGVRTSSNEQANQVSVVLELKGNKDVQRIPVPLTNGWATAQAAIDWALIGDFKEAVFVVTPLGGFQEGALNLDLDFGRFGGPKREAGSGVALSDAFERGVFNIGPATAKISPIFDARLGREVLKIDFTIPSSAVAGVWTKGYPARLAPSAFNAVSIGVRSENDPSRQTVVALELKGAKEVQRIPIPLKSGWGRTRRLIDWALLGDIREAVFVITPIGGRRTGAYLLDLEFIKIDPALLTAARTGVLSLMDAKERGPFNTEGAQGVVVPVFDETLKKDVVRFDFVTPSGTLAGLWAKTYPALLAPGSVNRFRAAVKIPANLAGQVAVDLELKGTKETQRVSLPTTMGWNEAREAVDWTTIGDLNETVFVVSPLAGNQRGTLQFDLDFLNETAIGETSSTGRISLLSAQGRGAFNIGESQGTIAVEPEPGLKKDVVRFDYNVPTGTVVGLWSKDYPSSLNSATVNSVKLFVKGLDSVTGEPVDVTVELKGTNGVQRLPLRPTQEWVTSTVAIDWGTVGTLKEAVFAVAPAGGARRGTLWMDLEFFRDETPRPSGPSLGRKFLLLMGAAALLALLIKLLGGLKTSRWLTAPGLGRDILLSTATILAAGAVILVHRFGGLGVGAGYGFLWVPLLGAGAQVLYRWTLSGRSPTPGEAFGDFALIGWVGLVASGRAIWQAPSAWSQIILEGRMVGSLVLLLFFGLNLVSLISHRVPLKTVPRLLLVGLPSAFGLLLALENPTLLRSLADMATVGWLDSWPAISEFLGRLLVVGLFNEIVMNAIGWMTKGQWVRSPRAHGMAFFVSAVVVASPTLADIGSTASVASMGPVLGSLTSVLAAMMSQAGLWMEVYLLTGLVLDAVYGYAPTRESVRRHAVIGLQKGMAYSGLFMGILYGLSLVLSRAAIQSALIRSPLAIGLVGGAFVFPFLKTIIESFDGSMSFFRRLVYSYKNATLYVRGAVAGLAFAYGISENLFVRETSDRLAFGLLAGVSASLGVSLLRDFYYGLRNQGRVQTWRLYLTDGLLGGFVGGMLAFYMDASQVPVIVEKFKFYVSAGLEPKDYTIYPLLSKWGRVDLGAVTGGVKLFYNEALAGVITWSMAAWLFAINRVFMQAFFQKDKAPVRRFFSPEGGRELMVNTLHVVRWGLWMAPIINTGLRMMGEATWYNQDGAIRSLWAIFKTLTLSPSEFQAWSLAVFVSLLAYDAVRILIWLDHMGLRVATLVNLSFIGLERLDNRVARFIGAGTAQKCIPEGIKRFATWAPLLIPFYIPRGTDWDYAWSKSLEIQKASGGGYLFGAGYSAWDWLLAAALATALLAGVLALWRIRRGRVGPTASHRLEIANRSYRVVLKDTGEIFSEISTKGYDLTRRSYDTIDPCGRSLFLVDTAVGVGEQGRTWPIIGNYPRSAFQASGFAQDTHGLRITNTAQGLTSVLTVTVPDADAPVELWTLTIDNPTDDTRSIKAVPYLEWVLDRPESDKGHTQYLRLFPEMEYAAGVNAILTNQRKTKSWGFIASESGPEGFHTSRMDFIGRGGSLWSPRLLETLDFLEPRDTAPYPTFDPIGSLVVGATLPPKSSQTFRFLIGFSRNRDAALDTIKRFWDPQPSRAPTLDAKKRVKKKKQFLIGHGEILPGTPQPYAVFSDDGNALIIKTPFTPRPFDHAMSNAKGHYVMVTNRGLHTTSNGNSQQNAVTPDWPDTVTREIPAEALYLYDIDQEDWFSPTHHPINDPRADHESTFSVDGTAVFRMERGTLSTELTVFVPPTETLGVYLLTVRNHGAKTRRLRVAPYFQINLVGQAETRPRPLIESRDPKLDALYFENPTNDFRFGPAFASLSLPAEKLETRRGRFFGAGRGVDHPRMVETGEPDASNTGDDRSVAAFLSTVEIPAQGEQTIAVVLGQVDTREQAEALIRKYKSVDAARASLEETRRWWLSLMNTLKVETSVPEFDHYQNWLKYQAVAERLWARRGFYQTSGAYGFRDQLQDSVNLVWVDPALARKQILLHASQQFLEGDVVHWFHTLHDGRTAFSNRSHASDNLLWLAWAASEYTRLTGDTAILDEKTSYLRAETPFLPLPHNKHGWGTIYPRSTRQDTLYRHCMKAVDLVLEKRMGEHGLPLIATGDWNDGLDEIGSEGRGESVWLGFFLHYILKNFLDLIEKRDGTSRKEWYLKRLHELESALENTWREDRYLRAIHDDGTEIGLKDSGVWEIDALTAAWAVYAGINWDRAQTVFQTALKVLERDNVILLGWPALREDTKPYLGRSSHYPEGVRENGMYCHGVQWLVRAARLLAERFDQQGDKARAKNYRDVALRLWLKISPLPHVANGEIEIYGGQPNKQSADMLTTFDQGRMIWHGYTGAAGWMLRQAMEGVVGATLAGNAVQLPDDINEPRGALKIRGVHRDLSGSPLKGI